MHNEGRENSGQSGILYGHLSLLRALRIVCAGSDVARRLERDLVLHLPTMAPAHQPKGVFCEYLN